MAVKKSRLILQEVFDKYRLWGYLIMIHFSSELDFLPILGNEANFWRLSRLLLLIERTNSVSLFPKCQALGEKSDESSPGSIGSGEDWMYYDPVAGSGIGGAEARHLSTSAIPPIPDGHQVHFNYDMDPDWWFDNTVGWNRNNYFQDRDAGVGSWEGDDAEMV